MNWFTSSSFSTSSAPKSINSKVKSSTSIPLSATLKKHMRLNMNSTEPVVPSCPPPRLKWDRTLATVRLLLSVAVST